MQVTLRWMYRRDMPRLLEIERLAFVRPWTEEDFWNALKCRNVIGLVAESKKSHAVVGYCVYQLEGDSLSILNMAVEPCCQRAGIGTTIVDRLKEKLIPQKRTQILATVHEQNTDAHFFLSSQGLWAKRVLRDHWDGVPGDAYLFQFSLDGSPAVYWGGRLSAYRPPVAEASCDVDE